MAQSNAVDGTVRTLSYLRCHYTGCDTYDSLQSVQEACRPYIAELTKVDEAVAKVLKQLNSQVADKLGALNAHVANNVRQHVVS